MIGSVGVVLNAAREAADNPAPEWLAWVLLAVIVILLAGTAYLWKTPPK